MKSLAEATMPEELLDMLSEEDNLSVCCGAEIKLGFCSDCKEHC